MQSSHSPVLIVGAGPTGLVLALWLTKAGVQVRLIDKAPAAGTASRALVIHARTLEFYRQLGIADAVLQRGIRFPKISLWVQQSLKAQISLGENGKGISPFPYVVVFPQDQHENLLIEELGRLGVQVERQTELISFEETEHQIQARLRLASGEIRDCTAEYVAGCDGAHSQVRKILEIGFAGGTYPDIFYVADAVGEGPVFDGGLHVSLDEADFLAVFPMKHKGHGRFIGVVRDPPQTGSIQWQDVSPRIQKEMDLQVKEVNWFSTYHVHHRVATHFQKGRAFLLGDAGHIHSPVGGQGMNTGIGDAVNLGWKLADVLQGRANEGRLRSYETERIGFARRLIKTTDQAFQFVSSEGKLARFVRTKAVPLILPALFHFRSVKRFLFKTVSQTGISYREQNRGNKLPGMIQPGDRLPWIESVDNYAPLSSLNWQIHIYGDLKRLGAESPFPKFQFPWNQEMAEKGLQKDLAYLIRPDGHIENCAAD